MKRKLMLLNLGLLAAFLLGAINFYQQVRAAGQRYQILEATGGLAEIPSFSEPDPRARVRPADYMPIVDRLLLYPDRNPVVVVEAPAPEPVKRPDLPRLIGVMDLGDGPLALMAPDDKTPVGSVAVGEKVGEYVFRGVSGDKITLEWQGQQVELAQASLTGRPAIASSDGARPSSSAARRRQAAKAAPAAAAATQESSSPAVVGGKYKIGKELRPGIYAVDPTDNSPDGTEANGYVKTVRRTPFGSQSWWEKKGEPKAP